MIDDHVAILAKIKSQFEPLFVALHDQGRRCLGILAEHIMYGDNFFA